MTSWILLIAALLSVFYSAAIFIVALQYPSDGLSTYLVMEGLGVESAPVDSAVQSGDIVIAINGRDVSADIHRRGVWREFLFSSSAHGATYTLLRGAARTEVEVAWHYYAPLDLLGRVAPMWIVAFSFLVTLGLILLSRDTDKTSTLVAIEFGIVGFNLINNTVFEFGANVVASMTWWYSPWDLLSYVLEMSFILHVLSVFPEKKWLAQRKPLVLYMVHGLGLLLAACAYFGAPLGPNVLTVRGWIFQKIIYPITGVALLIGMGQLFHTYMTSQRPGVRSQIRWLAWGILIGPMPWLLLYNLPVVLTGRPVLPRIVSILPLILVSVSFFFSVTGRGLLVIDKLLNRSLVYITLVSLLLLTYFLSINIVKAVFLRLLGVANQEFVAIIVVIFIAIVAAPLHTRLQWLVDRILYRHWLDLRHLLNDIGGRLATTVDLETLTNILLNEIPQRLHISQAQLLLPQETAVFQALSGTPLTFSFQHPLVLHCEAQSEPLLLRTFDDAPMVAGLVAKNWEVVLPLRHSGQLRGLYLLGLRNNGELFGKDELPFLILLSQQIAAALENSQLYHQIQRHSQELEDTVHTRTQELASTNVTLEYERDRLNVILENMADGLLVTSSDARIVLVNPAFEVMAVSAQEYLLDRSVRDVLPCPQLVAVIEQAAQKPGQIFTADCVLDARVLRASSTALQDDAGIITAVRDVTHEVAVDRMKTEFISTVSHELRTPLTSVLGFTKLITKALERDIVPAIDRQHRRADRAVHRILENLNIISLEGERLTRLINDVLDIAKMDAGRAEWHNRLIDPLELLHIVCAEFSVQAQENHNVLSLNAPDTLPPLLVDSDRLQQVLVNLISNAIKFTLYGDITVQARPISAEDMFTQWHYPSDNPGGIWIAVQDTGSGIPAQELPNLFQRFKQVREDVLINKPKGTGLGLAICRQIVTHYKGLIWAESELGAGSTFMFILPLPREGEVETVGPIIPLKAAPYPVDRQHEATLLDAAATVLIVDDEAHIRMLLAQELTAVGYRILEAEGGVAALMMARRYQPTLILLDVMMPDISGFDVTRLLKSDAATAKIPILILSIVEDREHSIALGAEAYLTKPIDVPILLRTVARLANGDPAFDMAKPTRKSTMEDLTTLLRERGFKAVAAHTPQRILQDVAATSPATTPSLQTVWAHLHASNVNKVMHFQDEAQAYTIIATTLPAHNDENSAEVV